MARIIFSVPLLPCTTHSDCNFLEQRNPFFQGRIVPDWPPRAIRARTEQHFGKTRARTSPPKPFWGNQGDERNVDRLTVRPNPSARVSVPPPSLVRPSNFTSTLHWIVGLNLCSSATSNAKPFFYYPLLPLVETHIMKTNKTIVVPKLQLANDGRLKINSHQLQITPLPPETITNSKFGELG